MNFIIFVDIVTFSWFLYYCRWMKMLVCIHSYIYVYFWNIYFRSLERIGSILLYTLLLLIFSTILISFFTLKHQTNLTTFYHILLLYTCFIIYWWRKKSNQTKIIFLYVTPQFVIHFTGISIERSWTVADGSESPGIETTIIINDLEFCERNYAPDIDNA